MYFFPGFVCCEPRRHRARDLAESGYTDGVLQLQVSNDSVDKYDFSSLKAFLLLLHITLRTRSRLG